MGRTPDGFATAKQLWRLNAEGRLEIRPARYNQVSATASYSPDPSITVEQADAAIRESVEIAERIVALRELFGGTQAAPTEL